MVFMEVLRNYTLTKLICQIRYSRGYRYYDISGKTLLDIEKSYPEEWQAGNLNIHTGNMNHKTEPLELGFSANDASMSYTKYPIDDVSPFQDWAIKLFPMVEKNLELEKYTRFGFRSIDIRGVESPAAGVALLQRSDYLTPKQDITQLLGKKLVGSNLAFRVEDDTSGIRLNVILVRRSGTTVNEKIQYEDYSEAKKSSNHPSEREFAESLRRIKEVLKDPPYGFLVDVDYYEKNPSSLNDIPQFFARGFERRRAILEKLFKE